MNNTPEDQLTTSRRTLIKGAAWTVPVIATATAAPLAVASIDCPDLIDRAGWSPRQFVSGSGLTGDSGPYSWQTSGSGVDYFAAMADNSSTTGQTVYKVTRTFEVEAGKTYTFDWGITSNLGRGSGTNSQRLQVLIGPVGQPLANHTTLYAGATAVEPAGFERIPRFGSVPNNNNITFTPQVDTYTPAVSGTVEFVYLLTLARRWGEPGGANDDIYFTTPTVTC